MTYCVGMCLNDGLVMMSDSRTNAGVDNISPLIKVAKCALVSMDSTIKAT